MIPLDPLGQALAVATRYWQSQPDSFGQALQCLLIRPTVQKLLEDHQIAAFATSEALERTGRPIEAERRMLICMARQWTAAIEPIVVALHDFTRNLFLVVCLDAQLRQYLFFQRSHGNSLPGKKLLHPEGIQVICSGNKCWYRSRMIAVW